MDQLNLKPSQILFTQDSIRDSFTDGKKLKETFIELVRGEKTVDDIETIGCMEYQDKYWVVYGNRRLFLFKILEEGKLLRSVRVNILYFNPKVFWKKRTTGCHGRWVCCRQNKDLDKDLKYSMECNRLVAQAGGVYEEPVRIERTELFDFWRTVHNDEDLERYRQETKELYGEITNDESSWWWCAIL